MQITGTALLDGAPGLVWETLMDPAVLATVLPGCEKLEETGPDSFNAHLSLGVAAIKGKYQGRVKVADKQPPTQYRLLIEGEGGPGWVKASMTIQLAPHEEKTKVTYDVDAQVGGLVASVGSRMLSGVAKMLLGDMFKNVNKQIHLRQAG